MPRLFLPCLLAVGSAWAAPVKIACVGDSITEGAGLANPSLEAYPPRLQRLLGTNYTVRNFGVSGRTLLKKGDFPYWNEAAFTQSKTFAPDVVIIQLGTNDSKPQNWRQGTNFVSDCKALIAAYSALVSAPRVFLCTPCTVFRTGAFDINPGIIHTNIAPLVRDLSAELNLPLIDLHTRLTDAAWFPDTVHPNTRGMAAMSAVMFEAISGPPPGAAVALEYRRLSATRAVLSWPATAGSLIPQYATALKETNTVWTVNDAVPYTDGETIRQTNTVSGAARFFELRRP